MNSPSFNMPPKTDWQEMTHNEQQRALLKKQKELLDTFLSHGAIDRRQYEKSLTCMTEKMGMQAELITEC